MKVHGPPRKVQLSRWTLLTPKEGSTASMDLVYDQDAALVPAMAERFFDTHMDIKALVNNYKDEDKLLQRQITVRDHEVNCELGETNWSSRQRTHSSHAE
jgi:hypothetical protein